MYQLTNEEMLISVSAGACTPLFQGLQQGDYSPQQFIQAFLFILANPNIDTSQELIDALFNDCII